MPIRDRSEAIRRLRLVEQLIPWLTWGVSDTNKRKLISLLVLFLQDGK